MKIQYTIVFRKSEIQISELILRRQMKFSSAISIEDKNAIKRIECVSLVNLSPIRSSSARQR